MPDYKGLKDHSTADFGSKTMWTNIGGVVALSALGGAGIAAATPVVSGALVATAALATGATALTYLRKTKDTDAKLASAEADERRRRKRRHLSR
jgi:hypothetical protein